MPKILLVDDDAVLRKVYVRFLRQEGFEVLESWNGEHALLNFIEEPIDVILLDIQMPVVSGNVLISALQHFHPTAKIIIFSCYSISVQKRMIDGAKNYFDKSEGCVRLISKIKALLESHPDTCNAEHIP